MIGWADFELTPSKRQKTGPNLLMETCCRRPSGRAGIQSLVLPEMPQWRNYGGECVARCQKPCWSLKELCWPVWPLASTTVPQLYTSWISCVSMESRFLYPRWSGFRTKHDAHNNALTGRLPMIEVSGMGAGGSCSLWGKLLRTDRWRYPPHFGPLLMVRNGVFHFRTSTLSLLDFLM